MTFLLPLMITVLTIGFSTTATTSRLPLIEIVTSEKRLVPYRALTDSSISTAPNDLPGTMST